ncbi:MAG: PP2C family serine/threonine-protein phosphatase, partial [Saprospiraceae bacterium]
MNDNWIVAKASVIGASHIKENLPCQDSHGYKFFSEDNFGIAVVSDGAGSTEFSHLGSGEVVQQVIEKFSKLTKEETFHLNAPELSIWNKKSVEVFKSILTALKEFAEEEKINYKSLAATAIVIIITPYGLLTTHIGDGRAGYLNEKGEWLSCITPYKGELANETVFITSDFWEDENFEKFIKCRII